MPALGSSPTLPAGFGRYWLERRLAGGGLAEVFIAEHRGEAGFSTDPSGIPG